MVNFATSHFDTTIQKTVLNKWSQQYVELPISLKMKTNEMNNFIYYGKIGISPMIRTSAKIDKINSNEVINLFNASFIVGAGIHYTLGGSTMAVAGLSFHNGLLRTNKAKEDIFLNNSLKEAQLKPSYIAIDLGILF
jgi:hypothetical protein